jgi:cytochrome b6-f complex iron-sulfur subunit
MGKKQRPKPKAVENRSPSSPDTGRRSVLNLVWIGLGAVAMVEFAMVIVNYLKPSRKSHASSHGDLPVVAGSVAQYPPQTVTAFIQGKFYLCCLKDGGFLAVSRQCTHLGCTVPWDEEKGQFICPCHASAYDIHGDVVSPPAPRALDIYPVRIVNNQIEVDTAHRIRRDRFAPEQVVYPRKDRLNRG